MGTGDEFEHEVADLLRLLPYSEVTPHVRIAGKDVDIVLTRAEHLREPERIAIECKSEKRPLTHAKVAEFVTHYFPLLAQNEVDAVYLITKNGVVANGESALVSKMRHWRYSDLADQVLAPKPLVADMVNQFTVDGLDKYYVDTSAYDIDLNVACKYYSLFYNPFIEFALCQPNPLNFSAVVKSWNKGMTRRSAPRLIGRYDKENFVTVMSMRLSNNRVKLKQIVDAWVANESCSHGLALLGSYGSGKSSFARHLAWDYAQRFGQDKTARLPLLIELRHFGAHQNIEALITDRLVNHHGMTGTSFAAFAYLNMSGRILLIMDGFDEMKQAMSRDSIVFAFSELNKLVVGRSKVLLCGRPSIFGSDVEQSEILSAGDSYYFEHSAKYIQINVAPLDSVQIIRTLTAYAETLGGDGAAAFARRSTELARELDSNEELVALLSRPVHLPMLIKTLPSVEGKFADLRRADLYGNFIDYTIQRDVTRSLQGQDAARYSTHHRRQFARAVATEMCRAGETRAIRSSLLPDALFLPFKRRSESLEEVRRSLIAACFLERRRPDLLVFPHKSYSEFLVAETVVDALGGTAETDDLGITYSPEVLSFVAELMPTKGWRILLDRAGQNDVLAARFLAVATAGGDTFDPPINDQAFRRAFLAESGFRTLASLIDRLGPALRAAIAAHGHHVTVSGGPFSPGLRDLLEALVMTDCGAPSVNAYKALKVTGRLDNDGLKKLIGIPAYQRWSRKKWTDFPSVD